MKFVTTRAKQRRGETPGQERHSGRTAKVFLTLSLLRAHFYTGVFHTSYRAQGICDSRRGWQTTTPKLYLPFRHFVPNKGLHPLRCYAAIPAPLWVRKIFQIVPYSQGWKYQHIKEVLYDDAVQSVLWCQKSIIRKGNMSVIGLSYAVGTRKRIRYK